MVQRKVKVAVIGAGMAGLVSARELQKEGHHVTVFERTHRVGGIWFYDPRVDSDRLDLDPNRAVTHSSVYKSLRVNIPRQLMGFQGFPFTRRTGGDTRSLPCHVEVLRYLEDYASEFGLNRLVRFGHEVVRVEPVGDKWAVGWKTRSERESQGDEIFQAVVVCNGINTEPKVADFLGRDVWSGIQIHSHNYRTPDEFRNKVVLVIGNGASARDILFEVSDVAKEVHQALKPGPVIWEKSQIRWHQHPMIKCVQEDGRLIFDDGTFLYPDVIIHCTGYNYRFPFLKTNAVTVEDNRVGPLYKHVFPPSLAPWLSFVGLPKLVVPAIVMELQAKWVARVLSGKLSLPSGEEMASRVEEFYLLLEKARVPKHHTHKLRQEKVSSDNKLYLLHGYTSLVNHPSRFCCMVFACCQWVYENWLAATIGEPPLERWKEDMSFAILKVISAYGNQFRDAWDVDNWIHNAKLSSKL